MSSTVVVEIEFLLLIAFSLILPALIYAYMMWTNSISRLKVGAFGFSLILIAGVNLILLRRLAGIARKTLPLVDDRLFVSEISVALYLLPALFAGVGVNIISHLLISHLNSAERRYDNKNQTDTEPGC
jgi:hypothetical protein